MSNPVCISPLKFYDDVAKQSHRKSYAYGHISPLLTKIHRLPPFQFIIPTFLYNSGGVLANVSLIDAKTEKAIEEYDDITDNANFQTGGFYNLSGNWQESPNWASSDFISTENIEKIKFYNSANSLMFSVAFFDISRNILTSKCIAAGPSSGASENIIEADIPSDAAYFVASTYIAGSYQEKLLVLPSRLKRLLQNGFSIDTYQGYKVAKYNSNNTIFTDVPEGLYYLKLASANDTWAYYSEVFCFTEVTQDLIELEYWNETGNFAIKNGVIAFPADFHFKLLLKGEIGKPEYNFEEESTKRLGYVYVESQVSKKTYKFNTIVPEYICDALRLVRLCDNKIIRYKDDEYEAITFEMEAEWQTQGDLASVTCEFETDNVIANIGGFVPDKLGGDYNNDYDDDFDKQ